MLNADAALQKFLTSFANLDWEPFRESFAEDATVFFPQTARNPRRVEGKAAIEAVFQRVFENARQQENFRIEPVDLRLEVYGEVAVATFHLDDPGVLCRRSLVLKKVNDKWLVAHLHASNIELDALG